MTRPKAVWTITLDVRCPHCKNHVDLLDHPDFWQDRAKFTPGEVNTPATTNVPVVCPVCEEGFHVDLGHHFFANI